MDSNKTFDGSIRQERLDSWKSIARYLGRSSRTVQRWHAQYGLPIYRLGGQTGSVFTFADELDDWMRNRGLEVTAQPPAFGRPVLLSTPHPHLESDSGSRTFDFSLIHSKRKAQSAEMVALGSSMWESVSYNHLEVIARCFREAIDLDPGNHRAFSGLSFALIVEGFCGLVHPPDAYNAAKIALRMAQKIDSGQPGTLCTEACLKMLLDRDWQGAHIGFSEALKRRPQSMRALCGLAALHIAEGNPQKASGLFFKAAQQSALASPTMALYCWSKYLAGEYAHTLHQIEQYRASGRSGPIVDAIEAMASIQLEEPDAHIERIEALLADSPHHEVLRGALGYAYGAAGHHQNANEILDAMTNLGARQSKHEPYALALVFIGLNRRQEAVKQLEQSYQEGSLWSLGFLSDPMLDTLRNDPHFLLFLSKVSYPVAENADSRQGFVG